MGPPSETWRRHGCSSLFMGWKRTAGEPLGGGTDWNAGAGFAAIGVQGVRPSGGTSVTNKGLPAYSGMRKLTPWKPADGADISVPNPDEDATGAVYGEE